ncbi:ubiquinol-cytochrome c reductase complex assembly factor 1-like isoform X2 [Dysidea avara]|uniref:ubiquinol-cytochrome c reductase complex assembly factor 1-like isoform X2 n=1 Tax=Dysidea avara TaxID=196820 RepID=UPI003320DA46
MLKVQKYAQHLEDAAVNLYHSVNDVNMREFFTVCKMPDTFQSFFTIHLLHFWMCLVRLNKEGDDGAAISKSMSKIFWQDMRDRMGMLGPMKPKVTRNNRKILDSQFFMDILSYDEAIVSHDIVLASIMWRKFLSTSDAAKADPVLLALLVEYVRKQVHHLDHISSEQLLKDGKITWLPLTSDHYSIK